MARTADKPGTFRVLTRHKRGDFLLSGVRADGTRVKVPFPTKGEAEAFAKPLFPAYVNPSPAIDWQAVDDWGVPLKLGGGDAVAGANAKLGLPGPLPKVDGAAPNIVNPLAAKEVVAAKEVKEKKAKQAQSLMEMIGMGAAVGDVMFARKLCERAGKDPVKPNPKQVNDLADATKDTLVEWFGDREIKPWQMMILLGIGLPLTMLLQSPKKKLPATTGSEKQSDAK